ncbi:AAA family ATPase [Nonomuraea sp. NPDC050536]|uniref:AAA family ATPase n=1 Tax=Nonomuraea sp. NPDC050536 TaxID=3364366 RepID=UPI0037CC87E3
MSLFGRQAETGRLDELIQAVRQGRGGALVLRGEPGIGKSALLEYAASRAADFRIVWAAGSEFEMELPFAALHQLCAPALRNLAALPAPHRRALEAAFGLEPGASDPFRVGIATLGLLAESAHDRPLLCVIDDAQWLDQASAAALAFLARRVSAEPMLVLFAVREPPAELIPLPGLVVGELPEAEVRALLSGEVLDERVRERILAEARGNPLALRELPRAGGELLLPDSSPLISRIEQSFLTRLEPLPAPARLLLTLAAADPVGDPVLQWRAADLLGLNPAAAESSTLIEYGTRVRFSHPLARSAVYRAATQDERRRAHRALAEATDPRTDPDRAAWHRALAASGPDEAVAAELAACAARAQARGGAAAAAAFLERSAELTPEQDLRGGRVLAAAQAKLAAGDLDGAAGLLAALLGTLTPAQRAEADLLRGRLSFARHRGGQGATAHLLRAAGGLRELDATRSRDVYLDALEMGLLTGELREIVSASGEIPPAPEPGGGSDAVLDAMVSLVRDGHQAAVPILRPLLGDISGEVWIRRPSLAFLLAVEMWDFDALLDIARHIVAVGRASGSFHTLPIGLAMLATASAHAGDFGTAMEAIAEGEAIADVTGASPLVYPAIHLAALRGRAPRDAGHDQSLSGLWAAAVLGNSLGDYERALIAAQQAVTHDDLAVTGLALPELVEAAVRCGQSVPAAQALEQLSRRTRASGAAWGLGVESYARALLTGDEDDYRAALDHLEGGRAAVSRARAHLLYGEWLRRQGRRKEARDRLREAHDLFAAMGSEAFAARAAGELRATGERARSRAPHAYDALTLQETHIARLVATGATSREVAARLFLSPRTVDAHLRNIFRKLGITSRRQLRDLEAP